MSNIKITMTIELPGGTMVTQAQAKELKQGVIHKMNLSYFTGKGKNKKVKYETLLVHTRPSIPAHQAINISEEAFFYYKSCPLKNFKLKEWKKLPIETRVKMHLSEYAESLGGKLVDFHIFDD